MADTSDRNLLFGILAVQLEFINSDQLVEAANSWMLDKGKSLGDILVERDALPADDRRFLEQIVDKHIAKTGSPKESLERLQDFGSSIQTGAFVERFRSAEMPTDEIKLNSTHVSSSTTPDGHEQTLPLRYKFLKDLARGGLGRVSVARDVELERDVALKEILNDKVGSAEARDRFVLEAKITGSLEHPGIVPVYGLGNRKDGSPYYAMRLIRGKSLHKEIKNLFETERGKKSFASLDQPNVRRLLRGIVDACNAVAYAHSRGVLHRDLKPSNIMLGKYGETLVVDWGLAKVLGDPNDTLLQSEPAVVEARLSDSSLTMMGSVLGSPGYMSPEQAQGRLDLLDVRSDVFCLGACLYFLLTNQAPFQGNSRESTLEAARSNQFQSPREVDSTIPKALEAICLRAMAKESSDRYETASDLADDIDRWIAGEPVMAMVEPVWQRAGRWARRNQTLVASTIALLVASFVALAISNRVISGERDIARQERDRANELRIIADEATSDARHERDIAEQRKVEADAANQIAQNNSTAMLEVLSVFVETLADNKWSEFPSFENERLSMVTLAVDRVEELYSESPNDAKLRERLITLNDRLALLYRMTGKTLESKKRLDRVLELCDSMSMETANDYALVADALALYINLLEQQQPASAMESVVRKATEICRQRLKMDPDNWATKLGMTRALIQLGELQIRMQAFDDAVAAFDGAIEISAKQLEKPNTFAEPLFHFYALQMSGRAMLLKQDLTEAEKRLDLAISFADKCLETYPNNNNVVQFRQSVIVDKAALEFAKQNSEKGFELLNQSVPVFEELVKNWKDTVGYQRLLADLQLSLAEQHAKLKNLDAAREPFAAAAAFINNFPEKELNSAQYLPLRLRMAAVAVSFASEDELDARREEYLQAKNDLEMFDPLDMTLKTALVSSL